VKKTVWMLMILMMVLSSAILATGSNEESYQFSYTLNNQDEVEQTFNSSDVVTVSMKPSDQLALYIPANATTGYQWVLKDDFEDKFVQLASTDYVAPDSELMGAGGTSVWIFNANEEGVTTLAFEYLRPWETDVEPEIVLLIQVHIKAK